MIVWHVGKRPMLIILALAIIVAGWVVWQKVESSYIVATVSAQRKLVPIYEVNCEKKMIAISFDASWGSERTEQILDILDKYHVKTTFFLVNIWIEDYPDLAAEIVERGHEIGLHSETHPHMTQLSDSQIIAELQNNSKMISDTCNYNPKLFRPPYGDYNNRVIELTDSLGYKTIQWSVDSLDWKDLSAEEIELRVLKDLHSGDIVLFHNNGLHTAEALPTIIEDCQKKGYKIVPISELLLDGDCYIDINGVQRQK